MIDTCPVERTELMQEYQNRLAVINEFAPVLVSDEKEIEKIIYRLLSSVDIRQDGKVAVMKAIMPQLKGKVDMKVANKVINEILKKSGEA